MNVRVDWSSCNLRACHRLGGSVISRARRLRGRLRIQKNHLYLALVRSAPPLASAFSGDVYCTYRVPVLCSRQYEYSHPMIRIMIVRMSTLSHNLGTPKSTYSNTRYINNFNYQ
eukprot:COSAG02_NODE_1237_length_13725_cov_27.071921_15_plen_114_part_00